MKQFYGTTLYRHFMARVYWALHCNTEYGSAFQIFITRTEEENFLISSQKLGLYSLYEWPQSSDCDKVKY